MLLAPNLTLDSVHWDRLSHLLPQWMELPVYRSLLAKAGLDFSTWDMAAAWKKFPLITKREMRDNFPANFLRNGQALDSLLASKAVELEYTSGSSGDRLPVLLGRGWWDVQEERALRLNGLVARVLDQYPQARRAVLTTPACGGNVCSSKWMTRSQRTLGNALSVNQARTPFLLSDDQLSLMAEEVAAWAPQFLDVDPVHGAWFALFCEKKGLRFPSLRFVACSYEFVSVVHRRILERVFGVPVVNLYGSTETGHLLMEDGRGAMKPSDDNALLEVVATDAAGVGDLLVTTLTNDFMPLVRYGIGDLVERRGAGDATAYTVHGRSRDSLWSQDGGRVTTWQVDQCFAGTDGLAHYQLTQPEDGPALLKWVPCHGGPSAESMHECAARLGGLLQDSRAVICQSVDLLPPEQSGKFRLTRRDVGVS